MTKINLSAIADQLPRAWSSTVVGQAAGANVKVLRMDAAAYPDESHDFDEALLVLDGCMRLDLQGQVTEVNAGEVFIVPAGVPHAVAPGSHGTLVIIDRSDILMGLLRNMQEHRSDLRIVVMSATLQTELFSNFFKVRNQRGAFYCVVI